jgi:diguanylate cyclase
VTALRLIVTETPPGWRGGASREKRARYMSFHDDLTRLPNRRYFRRTLRAVLRYGHAESLNVAVICLNLEGFKALHEAHGRDTGDQILRLAATQLARAVRAEDLVSRLGGAEYACLIFGVPTREELQRIASILQSAVSAPFPVGSQLLTVHPRIGIAVYPADGTTSEALMKAADTAMYSAQRSGPARTWVAGPDSVAAARGCESSPNTLGNA